MIVGPNMSLNFYQVIMGHKNEIVCRRDIMDI